MILLQNECRVTDTRQYAVTQDVSPNGCRNFHSCSAFNNRMKTLLLVSLLTALCKIGWVTAAPIPLEEWADKHPEASKTLGIWVKAHPAAAREFFEWDGHHSARAQEFVTWTIEHPQEHLHLYVREHPGEPYLDAILKLHALAAREFMQWCRNHEPAARALMAHSGGLSWAGHPLYREYWNLEAARR